MSVTEPAMRGHANPYLNEGNACCRVGLKYSCLNLIDAESSCLLLSEEKFFHEDNERSKLRVRVPTQNRVSKRLLFD